jgi:hypothetical protein
VLEDDGDIFLQDNLLSHWSLVLFHHFQEELAHTSPARTCEQLSGEGQVILAQSEKEYFYSRVPIELSHSNVNGGTQVISKTIAVTSLFPDSHHFWLVG